MRQIQPWKPLSLVCFIIPLHYPKVYGYDRRVPISISQLARQKVRASVACALWCCGAVRLGCVFFKVTNCEQMTRIGYGKYADQLMSLAIRLWKQTGFTIE